MTFDQLLLTQLMEECSEVIKEAAKVNRFGLRDCKYPGWEKPTNEERLQNELNDLEAVIEMIRQRLELPLSLTALDKKKGKIIHFMEYSRSVGVLDEPIPKEFADYGTEYAKDRAEGNG